VPELIRDGRSLTWWRERVTSERDHCSPLHSRIPALAGDAQCSAIAPSES
jgi:hypothetical protein